MSDDIFGSLVLPDEVEQAVISTCKEWMPEYLAFVERKLGLKPKSLPRIRAWVPTADLNRWPEETPPTVLVMNTGLAGEPEKYGKDYCAKFAVGLSVVAQANGEESSDRAAKRYTAILRAILTHHPDLGGLARAIEWVDEGYDALPGGKRRRNLAAGQLVMRVEVPDVVRAMSGPEVARDGDEPYDGPPSDLPTVTNPSVTVTPTALS